MVLRKRLEHLEDQERVDDQECPQERLEGLTSQEYRLDSIHLSLEGSSSREHLEQEQRSRQQQRLREAV